MDEKHLSLYLSRRSKLILTLGFFAASSLLYLAKRYFQRRKFKSTKRKPLKEVTPTRHVTTARAPSQEPTPITKTAASRRHSSDISSHRARASHLSVAPISSSTPSTSRGTNMKDISLCNEHEKKKLRLQLLQLGLESFDSAIQYWENAIDFNEDLTSSERHLDFDDSNSVLFSNMEKLLNSAYTLKNECEQSLTNSELSDLSLYKVFEIDRNENFGSSEDSDADSFVSASEIQISSAITNLETEEFMFSPGFLALYQESMELVASGDVECRTFRTQLLHCRNDNDFLAKLHCIRQGFDVLLNNTRVCNWFVSSGKQIIGALMEKLDSDPTDFYDKYDIMLNYVRDSNNWTDIQNELQKRKVKCMSFYDIVLDFFLMDAFDDLTCPPASIITISQNRWLSNGIKKTALSTAVWSVLTAKRKMLQNPDGFLSHFYSLSEDITPTLAWGFLGPNEDYKEICYQFKDEVLSFLIKIFSLKKTKYSSTHILADNILKHFQEHTCKMSQHLNCTIIPLTQF